MKCKIKLLTPYRDYKEGQEIESVDITKCKELVSLGRATWIEEPKAEKKPRKKAAPKKGRPKKAKDKEMKPRKKRGYKTK